MIDDPPQAPGELADFEAVVLATEPPLRRALVAAYGYEEGREAAAEALAYACERWAQVRQMPNAAGCARPHLAFAYGIHHCLGAPLARAEPVIASAALLQRFTGLRLAIPQEHIRWAEGRITRRIKELPIAWGAQHRPPRMT